MRRLLANLLFITAQWAVAADITGSARIAGKIPSAPTYEVEHDAEVCGTHPRVAQSLAVGTNQTVRDVIVYLGVTVQNGATNQPSVVLNQWDCEFVPRIQIARS